MQSSDYRTVETPNRPKGGWTGHIRKTGWKYGIRGTVPHNGVSFYIEPNTVLLVLKELPDESCLVQLYGDEQRTQCIISRVDFAMDTYPV